MTPAPLKLHRLPSGRYDTAALDAINADFILLCRGTYSFRPLSILFEYVRLATAASKGELDGPPIRLEATEQGPPAVATQIEVAASRLTSADERRLVFHFDNCWFLVGRGGEQPLVERLGWAGHDGSPVPPPLAQGGAA